MIITFQEAKLAIAQYAGKAGRCPEEAEVDLFVKEVIEELLRRGASGSTRKWVFKAENGRFTAPPDLELPISIHVGAEVGFSFDKWYEFYDHNTLADCTPCEQGIVEEPNEYFTVYDIPKGGARILAVPRCNESEDAHFVIQGQDENRDEIFMPDRGDRFKGEKLRINKDNPRFTQKTFTRITGITKTKTNHYVRLFWYRPEDGKSGFLGEYRPNETKPSLRRFRIVGFDRNCDRCFLVTILGRVRLLEDIHPNDVIPITNMRALKLTAQQIQSEDNSDIQTAQYRNQRVAQTIEEENQYKRTPSAPINFSDATSPGSTIKNLI